MINLFESDFSHGVKTVSYILKKQVRHTPQRTCLKCRLVEQELSLPDLLSSQLSSHCLHLSPHR